MTIFYSLFAHTDDMKMENLNDIFRAALKPMISPNGELVQRQVALSAGITPSELNDFLSGRRGLPEEKRRSLSKSIGYDYESFLDIGRRALSLPTVGESTASPIDPEEECLIGLVRKVLHSGNETIAAALRQNIVAFANAVDQERKADKLEKDVQAMKDEIRKQKARDCPVPPESREETAT